MGMNEKLSGRKDQTYAVLEASPPKHINGENAPGREMQDAIRDRTASYSTRRVQHLAPRCIPPKHCFTSSGNRSGSCPHSSGLFRSNYRAARERMLATDDSRWPSHMVRDSHKRLESYLDMRQHNVFARKMFCSACAKWYQMPNCRPKSLCW
jgi:hypothetical protein